MNKLLLFVVLTVMYSGMVRAEHDFDDMSFKDDGQAILAEQKVQSVLLEFEVIEKHRKECIKPIEDSSFYQRLDKKFILGNKNKLLEKMSLIKYATESDIKDINDYIAARESCTKDIVEGFKKIEPKLGMQMEILQIEENIDLIEVSKKGLTIGNMNKRHLERENHAIEIAIEFIDRIRGKVNPLEGE